MAKTRVEGKRVTSRKAQNAAKNSNPSRTTQAVTKPTRSRGRSARLEAGKVVVGKLKDARGRGRKSPIVEELEVLAKQQTQVTPDKQESSLMASNEANTATGNEAGAHGFLAINSLSSFQDAAGSAKSVRKSERIDAAHDSWPTGSNPATVFTVPRPRAKSAAKGKSENLGIVLADIGNYTTTASRVLGLGELEDIDFWNGAATARSSQIRTRVVARKGEDEEWDLEFGPDTDVVCEKDGEVLVFDNKKLAMNPASEHFQVQRKKEKKIGMKAIYRRFIEWLLHTIFDSSKTANPDIQYFRVYTGLPAEWPENISYQYQTIIENVSGWEGKVDVHIISEPTAAINGRLKSLLVEQRRGLGVYLEDAEHGGMLDIGDATGNITIIYWERYQAAASATKLVGFGNLNKIVNDILRTSEWLKTTFGDQSTTTLEIWMQTTFLTKYKLILGSGQQNKLEINNYVLPSNLADDIEEKGGPPFRQSDRMERRLWIATSGGGASSVPFQRRFNGKAGPYSVFHNSKNSCGEDVVDGLKQQPHIHSTIQDFQFNYGLPQDPPDVGVGETDKPQRVLVIGEKGTQVPDIISSIPYYIPQPPDGKWEMDLTILKSDKDLSGVEPTKGLNHKEVTADGWTELSTHRIPLPFDKSLENFGVSSVDVDNKPIINGCVYILIELRGIQFVIHAIGRSNGKEDVGLRNSRTTKRLGYGVDESGDTSKYFHVMASTPIRILQGTEVEPIEIDSESDEDEMEGDN
ncbi:hypothetical protein EJ05DRAFT_497810 [Pseudovirgaria hyperparasitica]|uniref:Actin-like ATPase domain-containing protein n=1 Tax=Pseudovirgaria hyperparasitica TaxID=470096 RepID=A0A6A6WJ23_9PEZI|nr:uncharacterized protein EJ05DRAFT_497810 [Pseudovirgaria hyperparasitica]KAF2761261.1 hypothetical protein EJ05DRAFT_497810 [Pseudovirgaria hyperparasitica]